jgi:hypothetical protein
MMLHRVLLFVAGAAAVVVAALLLAVQLGGRSWDRARVASVESLYGVPADPAEPGRLVYSPDELEGLPDAVRRYFVFALQPGQPIIRRARITHSGVFRMKPGGADMPFESTQYFSVDRPGFVWDARIGSAPVVIRVRDSYIAGRGGILAKLGGVMSVADVEGEPHIDSGSFHRYVLEAPWYPTALLPSQGVRWEALTDSTARATMTDGDLALSMDITFAPDGRIVRVVADRLRDVDGAGVLTPFEAVIGDYQPVAGIMVPREGEVAWLLPEGRHAFWRGRITDIHYEFADQPAQ